MTDLIKATPEDDVLRRDIYDRPPIFNWSKVRAAGWRAAAAWRQAELRGWLGPQSCKDCFGLAWLLSTACIAPPSALQASRPLLPEAAAHAHAHLSININI